MAAAALKATDMANAIDPDVVEYCRGLTDKQLRNVLNDEYKAYQHRDYPSAQLAAAERGWRTDKGKQIE